MFDPPDNSHKKAKKLIVTQKLYNAALQWQYWELQHGIQKNFELAEMSENWCEDNSEAQKLPV